jgi:ankyrin repeat protein
MHWAALQLDEQTLSILCTHVIDIDVLDRKGRTPLYLACVEGKVISIHLIIIIQT